MNGPSQRAGDTVHEVVHRYSDMVYRLACARTGNRADADDVYQEVFLKLFTSNPNFESEEHRKAWLIRTTIHVSVNLLKSAWRRRVLPAEELFGAASIPAESSQDAEALRRALGRMPEKIRVVLYLFYYEEMSTEQIAQVLQVKPSTVRSRLKRRRDKLKLMLSESEAKDHA